MTGVEALKALRERHKVRRDVWLPRIYAVVKDNEIHMFRSNERIGGTEHQYAFHSTQLLYDDWQIVE